MDTFGKRLKALRQAAGLTQGALGDKAGFTWNGIAQLESGRRQPALATALALKRALGIDLTAFDPDVPVTVKAKPIVKRQGGESPAKFPVAIPKADAKEVDLEFIGEMHRYCHRLVLKSGLLDLSSGDVDSDEIEAILHQAVADGAIPAIAFARYAEHYADESGGDEDLVEQIEGCTVKEKAETGVSWMTGDLSGDIVSDLNYEDRSTWSPELREAVKKSKRKTKQKPKQKPNRKGKR
jgi:transcriptional regulator with XRE-family HTH domain